MVVTTNYFSEINSQKKLPFDTSITYDSKWFYKNQLKFYLYFIIITSLNKFNGNFIWNRLQVRAVLMMSGRKIKKKPNYIILRSSMKSRMYSICILHLYNSQIFI